jgi:hypothetical protein
MIYRVVTYDRTTDRMKGNLPIPSSLLERIKRIAGFGPTDDGLANILWMKLRRDRLLVS